MSSLNAHIFPKNLPKFVVMLVMEITLTTFKSNVIWSRDIFLKIAFIQSYCQKHALGRF